MEQTVSPYDILLFRRNERLADRYLACSTHQLDHKGKQCLITINLEIVNSWHHAREFGQQIISSVIREFAKSQSPSALIRFEQALKSANPLLSGAKEKLETEVNCSVTLMSGNEVSFASVGNSQLLLYRDGKVISVGEGTSTEPIFSSVTSGDLNNGEWLLSVNEQFAHFLKDLPSETWQEEESGTVTAAIVDFSVVESREGYSGVLVRFWEGRRGEEQTVVWDSLEPVIPIRLPKISLPKVNIGALSQSFIQLAKLIASKIKTIKPTPGSLNKSEVGPKHPLLANFRWQRAALIVLIILIASGALFLSKKFRAPTIEAKPTTIVEDLRALAEDQRQAFLVEHLTLANYTNLNQSEQAELSQIAAIGNLVIFALNDPLIELPEKGAAVDTASDQTTEVIDTTGQMWRLKENGVTKISQSLLIQSPTGLTTVAANHTVVSDISGNLWLFDGSPSQPSALALPSPLGQGTKIVQKFEKNIYLYELTSKNIFRVTNFDKTLDGAKTVVKSSLLNGTLTGFTVNGDIVTLNETGTIQSFRNGKATGKDWTIPASEKMFIASLPDGSKIATFDHKTLTISDKSGQRLQQYLIASKEPITDITFSADGISMLLMSDKALYKLTL